MDLTNYSSRGRGEIDKSLYPTSLHVMADMVSQQLKQLAASLNAAQGIEVKCNSWNALMSVAMQLMRQLARATLGWHA